MKQNYTLISLLGFLKPSNLIIAKINYFLVVLITLFGILNIHAQTTLISPTVNNGGFENNLTGWSTAQTGVGRGAWYSGTATFYAGTNSAYISNNMGTSNAYTGDAIRYQHLYKSIAFPAGETDINLSFYWKCLGEGTGFDWDNLKVYVSSTAPTAGLPNAALEQVGATWYNNSTTWQNAAITLPASFAGTTKYLIFQWKQDASTTNNPPAAIDNITLTSITPAACSGTPTPGNTIAATNPVVAGNTTALSLQNATTGSGVSYQWQSAAASTGPWSSISGATVSTYTATPTTKTWYRCIVTCSGNSGNSTPVEVTLAYCTPSSGSTATYINNFSTTLGSTNISNASGYTTGGYQNNFASTGVTSTASSTFNYNFTVVGGTLGAAIWIDWNQNSIFETGERVFVTTGYGSGPYSGSIAVPGGTAIGDYRMRVMVDFNSSAPSDPCITTNARTETEDYKLTIIAAVACAGTPTGGTVSTLPSIGSAGSLYTVAASGQTLASNMTYQWQYSTNGGGTWTNAGVPTSTYSDYTATAPAVGTTVLWHLVITCTNSGLNATSSNGTFNTTSSLNIPQSGSNTVSCGTNILLYDAGGPSGDYANSSNGYTVLEAGLSSTINITGSYNTENTWDFVKIYSGTGITGTLLGTYTGTGTINYTGTAGQTLTVQFTSDTSGVYSGFNLSVSYSGICFPACSGTPTGGTVSTSPSIGTAGSLYTISASGQTLASNMTYQWQYSTNGGGTWINAGTASSGYTNYTATAPAVGSTVLWHLVVTCVSSNKIAISTDGSFTSVIGQNIPLTGNTTVYCGTNTILYDNGGSTGNYANNSNGYTVLEAGVSATINISGSYETESIDKIRIYNGTGITGTLLATYSGTGTINYTGTAGQTLTVEFYSDGSVTYTGFTLNISYSGVCFLPCSGTPTGGIVSALPIVGPVGSPYTVSATGQTLALNMTYQWQYSTNGGGTWTNAGIATTTYSNYTATAPALGVTVLWHLVVSCTSSGMSATSSKGTFTSVVSQNIPASGSNTVNCGTSIVLYDNGGLAGNYANNSNGYTVLDAGLGSTITINGSYTTESVDYIKIYSGIGTTGTLLTSYSGTGTFSYSGTPGQTLTVQFTSDGSVVYSGFTLSVSYSGICFPACSGTPTGGSITTNPNTDWPGAPYVVSATGQTLALNMNYQWQYSTTGGTTWINAGAASSTYSNYNATAPASGNVLWQLQVTCVTSSQTAISSTGTFITMAVSTILTGCPNVVSGGLGLNGADPSPFSCTATSTCVDLEATFLNLGNTTSYIVEPIQYNPPAPFTGLANPVSVNNDDVWSPLINLPFNFCFYGNTYNKCLIGSNGILTFDTISYVPNGPTGYSFNSNLPSLMGDLFKNTIYGVYHDIDPRKGGQIGWELVTLASGCRALVASWNNVPMFSDNTILYTGMMVLYENTNVIEIYIKEKKIDNNNIYPFNDGNAIVGIQNANGTLATVAPGRNGLDTNWTATNEAWRFVPNGTSISTVKWYEGNGTTGPVVGTTPVISVCPASTTTYTAEVTYTLCNGATVKEIDTTTVTVNRGKTWNGSMSSNWNIPNNWTPTGIPNGADCVFIPITANNPIISGAGYNALAGTLMIYNNATLTLNSNNNITVTDGITVQANGNFIVNNNANLVQISNATNLGNITYKRDASIRTLDYVYWSSPVANQNINSLFSPIITGPKYEWNTTIANSNGGQGNWVNLSSSTMTAGKGYIVRGPSSAPFNNTTSNILTGNFIGVPNNGIFTVPIFRGTDTNTAYHSGTNGTEISNLSDNWNLLGNPYPSSIKGSQFLFNNRTKIEGNIRLWTHGNLPVYTTSPFYSSFVYNYTPGDYFTYTFTGTSCCPAAGADVFIGAGQGFFVQMKDGPAATDTVSFNNGLRNSSYPNNNFYKTQNIEQISEDINVNNIERHRIWLDIINSNNESNRTLFGYIEGATSGWDSFYDCLTQQNGSMEIYSLIEDNKFIIQGRPLPFDDTDIVPIGLSIQSTGNYSIGLAGVDGIFEEQSIYLRDKLLGIDHDIKSVPYHFTISNGMNNTRFEIVYRNSTLGNSDFNQNNDLKVIVNELVSVESTEVIKEIVVYNTLGQIIDIYKNASSNKVILSALSKTNTTLLLKIKLDNGQVYNKKIIY